MVSERYGGGTIVIHDYNPNWPILFQQERTRILDALGPGVLTIEHVGSTAVVGLAAKPIIDLMVGARSLTDARATCVEPLRALGYVYLPEYEAWLPEELFFRKGPPGPWSHHVHVMEPSNPRWDEFILVRDYLRQHREVVNAYSDLKKALALVFGEDIAGYREAKHPFLQKVLAMAHAEQARVTASA
jgi:GrpB-like predicted nucleotidyltransferase (UPF0157 family)